MRVSIRSKVRFLFYINPKFYKLLDQLNIRYLLPRLSFLNFKAVIRINYLRSIKDISLDIL